MSRIEELKKQNPNFNINVVDVLQGLFKKSKYTELLVNLIKSNVSTKKEFSQHKKDIIYELHESYGYSMEELESMNYMELFNMSCIITNLLGYNNHKTVQKFISFNEKKMIPNTDLSSYKSFEELELQVSLASLREIDKDMEKQVLKLYETDEWVVIRPLSYQASLKYGASTKWCTSSDSNPDYYFRYTKRGILIYCINKKTGDKTAAFKNLDNSYDRETSFWDITDMRIDSLETNLTTEVLNVIKNEFVTFKTNWELLSTQERNSQLLWLERYSDKNQKIISYYDEEPTPTMEGPQVLREYEEDVHMGENSNEEEVRNMRVHENAHRDWTVEEEQPRENTVRVIPLPRWSPPTATA